MQVEEADLVVQAKLIRTKDQRVPRLQDLNMRPTLSGKTVGSLEAHSNGLRFTSQKHAVRRKSALLRCCVADALMCFRVACSSSPFPLAWLFFLFVTMFFFVVP